MLKSKSNRFEKDQLLKIGSIPGTWAAEKLLIPKKVNYHLIDKGVIVKACSDFGDSLIKI